MTAWQWLVASDPSVILLLGLVLMICAVQIAFR